ncbi:hypothetical protein Y1Q_0014656 [Alligator mississippiensis]|uniref:Uncharacterized protein n=1 Tax=Alligator mississippiensis TaxID=8496 RepID=A0A151P829_ALLMI|nr:hypothetical protein Y1Q_0014656 [Alligator mississippiensis]
MFPVLADNIILPGVSPPIRSPCLSNIDSRWALSAGDGVYDFGRISGNACVISKFQLAPVRESKSRICP